MTYNVFSGTLNPTQSIIYGICRPVASVEGRAMLKSANYEEPTEPRTKRKRYGP